MTPVAEINGLLTELYGESNAPRIMASIEAFLKPNLDVATSTARCFSDKDVVLITYGDSIRLPGEKPLKILCRFLTDELKDTVSHVHILPFYPYSSDDGFSVIDYKKVNPELGSWDDIREIGANFELMFDLVLNHISAKSDWFARYLAGDPDFRNLAIDVRPDTDLSQVVRPRTLPLLTPFKKTDNTEVNLWTTFSADQIDLNYADPDVLIKMIEVMLFYVHQGATAIRLDAIAYLWKRIGTSCIHLNETHRVVKLLRKIFQTACPQGILLTETNVPHHENISYFGNGYDEAQLVYNFTLAPLLLQTFLKGDATPFNQWAEKLKAPSSETTFLNFTASHDGIGVRPLKGIVSDDDLQTLVQHVLAQGGRVSNRLRADGSRSPYELNITYVDAMKHNGDGDDPLHIPRFLASQAVALMLPGIPAVYIHSLLGSRNWLVGVNKTGRARTINREKLDWNLVQRELAMPHSFRHQVFSAYKQMLSLRRSLPALHPNATFEVWNTDSRMIAVFRNSGPDSLLGLVNVTDNSIEISLQKRNLPHTMVNVLDGCNKDVSHIRLKPYEILWLEGR